MSMACSTNKEKWNADRILVGKREDVEIGGRIILKRRWLERC
jgi:hypothetical protein